MEVNNNITQLLNSNSSCWSSVDLPNQPTSISPLVVILLLSVDGMVVLSNLIVVCVIVSNRHLLSSAGNLFILSLAISDLTLGVFVLPPCIVSFAMDAWPFGKWACRAWLALDVWLCTASIYNLLVITIDRFVAVTKPLSYKALITTNKVTVMILIAWTLSLGVCVPVFFLDRPELPECQCSHMYNPPSFALTSTAISFYVPFFIIIYFYCRIYRQVRKVTCSTSKGFIKLSQNSTNNSSASSLVSWPTAGNANLNDKSTNYNPAVSRLKQQRDAYGGSGSMKSMTSKDSSVNLSDGLRIHKGGYCSRDSLSKSLNGNVPSIKIFTDLNRELNIVSKFSPTRPRSQTWESRSQYRTKIADDKKYSITPVNGIARDVMVTNIGGSQALSLPCDNASGTKKQEFSTWKYYQRRLSAELKTLKTVGIVTGCVLLSWMGFCFIYALETLDLHRFQADIVSFFMWLGYVNSAVNPFLYAGYNRQYRQSLKKLFKFKTRADTLRQPGDATSLLFAANSNGSVRNQ